MWKKHKKKNTSPHKEDNINVTDNQPEEGVDNVDLEEDEDDTPKDALWNMVKTFRNLGIAILLAVLAWNYVVSRSVVQGNSMEKTLQDGDSLLVDKISYRFQEPERFDIVIFPYKTGNGDKSYLIKRIIGLPGETVWIKKGKIYINGEKLEENYGFEKIQDPGYAKTPIVLGEDSYFVLGDNRNASIDSRYLDDYGTPVIGLVKKEEIVGKAFYRIYPFETFGEIQ